MIKLLHLIEFDSFVVYLVNLIIRLQRSNIIEASSLLQETLMFTSSLLLNIALDELYFDIIS